MLLTAPSSAPTALYVPGASIALDDQSLDIRQSHELVFTQVEVDLELTKGSTFRFTIPHAFDNERGDFFTPSGEPLMPLFKLGTKVWIRMGYGGPADQKLLFSGFVTQVSTSFAEGGAPDLEVSGQDITYKMTLGTNEHRTENKSVRDAVNEVAQQNNVSLKFSGDPPTNVTLDANLQTDLDFLIKLAENFSKPHKKWDFFVRPNNSGLDELYFQPRNTDAKPIVELAWGVDLLSFKPDIDIGRQIQRVRILGRDELRKQTIIGEAVADKGKAGEKSGGDIQREAFGRETVLELRMPVKSKEEADQRAAAALANRTDKLLTGEGETFGLPDLLPGTVVKVSGIGKQFSCPYFVTKTVHRYDTSGYRTRFSVEKDTA
jgi:phage protein D